MTVPVIYSGALHIEAAIQVEESSFSVEESPFSVEEWLHFHIYLTGPDEAALDRGVSSTACSCTFVNEIVCGN